MLLKLEIHLPQTATEAASSVVSAWCEAIPLHHCALTVLPKLAPLGAPHFRLGHQSFSDRLHLEAIGMKEYDKEISLGLTCTKAFSNMQTRTVTILWRGWGFLHVFISDITYTPMEACFFIELLFSKTQQHKYAHCKASRLINNFRSIILFM